MKKIFIIAPFIFILIAGCNQANEDTGIARWEYKILEFGPTPDPTMYYTDISDIKDNPSIMMYDFQLNELGLEGWELVDSYLESNSYFVNIAKKKSNVDSLKPILGPTKLKLIFKRPLID